MQVITGRGCFVLMRAFADVLFKLKKHYGLKSDKDLADFLGIAQPTISNWKQRNTFDFEVIASKCKDVSLDWLFRGEDITASKQTVVAASLPIPPNAGRSEREVFLRSN